MVGVMMGLLLLVFSVLEESFGHAIAIASFAATTVSVFMQGHARGNRPLSIGVCYFSAAVVGYLVSLLPVVLAAQAGVALFVLVFGFLFFDIMHPPAVAYAFGFMLGGYGVLEIALTIPALFVYFVTLGVVVLAVERLASWVGLLPPAQTKVQPTTWYGWWERIVHQLVPYALLLLFTSLLVEFLYPELVEPHALYVRLLDIAILSLFVADLTFIYRRTQTVREFVRHNWVDILATIPFFIVFRLLQGATLAVALVARGTAEVAADVTRFSRFARPAARTPRFIRLLDELDGVGL